MGDLGFPSALLASKTGLIAQVKPRGLFACGDRGLIVKAHRWGRRSLIPPYQKRDRNDENHGGRSSRDEPSHSSGAHSLAMLSAPDFEEFSKTGRAMADMFLEQLMPG